jgi:dihydrofolate synthase / folylpolyglutamate synthase
LLGIAHSSIENALAAIAAGTYSTPPRVVITGSLYLAGEILALDGTEPR